MVMAMQTASIARCCCCCCCPPYLETAILECFKAASPETEQEAEMKNETVCNNHNNNSAVVDMSKAPVAHHNFICSMWKSGVVLNFPAPHTSATELKVDPNMVRNNLEQKRTSTIRWQSELN